MQTWHVSHYSCKAECVHHTDRNIAFRREPSPILTYSISISTVPFFCRICHAQSMPFFFLSNTNCSKINSSDSFWSVVPLLVHDNWNQTTHSEWPCSTLLLWAFLSSCYAFFSTYLNILHCDVQLLWHTRALKQLPSQWQKLITKKMQPYEFFCSWIHLRWL